MGKKTPAAPAPPDPYATAAAQTKSNVDTATANSAIQNANEFSPYGSVKYDVTGQTNINGNVVPQYTRTVSLAPDQQRLLDQQTQLGIGMNNLASDELGRLSTNLQQPIASNLPASVDRLTGLQRQSGGPNLDTSLSLQKMGTTFGDAGEIQRSVGPTDAAAARKQVQDALMGRLDPSLTRNRAALETNLINQGLVRGSAAFNTAMDQAGQQENDARLAVIGQAGQEEDRVFGQAVTQGTFANSAQQQTFDQAKERGLYGLGAAAQNNAATSSEADFRNNALLQNWNGTNSATAYNNSLTQQEAEFANTSRERNLQEQLAIRNQGTNEISALMNGGQVTAPQFTQYRSGTVDSTPVGQYVYNSAGLAQDQWKTQVQANAAQMGGLYSLGGAIAGGIARSDRRLKTNIRAIGVRTAGGFELYEYQFAGQGSRRHVGVMADEVEAVMPAGVITMADGFKAVRYAQVH